MNLCIKLMWFFFTLLSFQSQKLQKSSNVYEAQLDTYYIEGYNIEIPFRIVKIITWGF